MSTKGQFRVGVILKYWKLFVSITLASLLLVWCLLPLTTLAKDPSDTYTVERYYVETNTSSVQTTTSTSFVTAATLTFTPSADKDYIILASALTNNVNTADPTGTLSVYYTEVQLDIDGTPYSTTQHGVAALDVNWRGFGTHQVVSLTGGTPYTAKIEFRTENTLGTAQVRWCTIAAVEIQNRGTDYETVWHDTERLTTSNSYSASYQTQLSFDAAASTPYLILVTANTKNTTNNGECLFRVKIDGANESPTPYIEAITAYSSPAKYASFAHIEIVEFDSSGTQTVEFQWRSGSTNQESWVDDVRITMVKSAGEAFQYEESPATEETSEETNSVYPSWTTVTNPISFDPAEVHRGDYIIIASGLGRNEASGYNFYSRLAVNDGGTGETGYGEYMFQSTAKLLWRSFFMVRKVNLGYDANTIAFQFASNDGGSNHGAHIKQATIIAVYLDAAESYASAPPPPDAASVDNNFDGAGNIIHIWANNLRPDTTYSVAYYDASAANGGLKVYTDSSPTLSAYGNLKSLCDPEIGGAVAGTWHAVVYDTEYYGDGPEVYYNNASGNAGYIAEDTFDVGAAAIPEFPTALAAIMTLALSAGVYLWMSRRKISYVKA